MKREDARLGMSVRCVSNALRDFCDLGTIGVVTRVPATPRVGRIEAALPELIVWVRTAAGPVYFRDHWSAFSPADDNMATADSMTSYDDEEPTTRKIVFDADGEECAVEEDDIIECENEGESMNKQERLESIQNHIDAAEVELEDASVDATRAGDLDGARKIADVKARVRGLHEEFCQKVM